MDTRKACRGHQLRQCRGMPASIAKPYTGGFITGVRGCLQVCGRHTGALRVVEEQLWRNSGGSQALNQMLSVFKRNKAA